MEFLQLRKLQELCHINSVLTWKATLRGCEPQRHMEGVAMELIRRMAAKGSGPIMASQSPDRAPKYPIWEPTMPAHEAEGDQSGYAGCWISGCEGIPADAKVEELAQADAGQTDAPRVNQSPTHISVWGVMHQVQAVERRELGEPCR